MDIFGNKSSMEIFAEYFSNDEKQETAMERAFREAQEKKAKKDKEKEEKAIYRPPHFLF